MSSALYASQARPFPNPGLFPSPAWPVPTPATPLPCALCAVWGWEGGAGAAGNQSRARRGRWESSSGVPSLYLALDGCGPGVAGFEHVLSSALNKYILYLNLL